MFAHIEVHSSQLKEDVFLSARDKVVGYVPKVRVGIILEDERAKTLLDELRGSGVSFAGKGVYWVFDVDEVGVL